MAIIRILLVILILCLISLMCNKKSDNNPEKFDQNLKYADEKVMLQIYQMLYDTDKILNQNKIPYWIEGGTLLGAVRHSGIIPWDDDADIQILTKYRDQLLSLQNNFSNKGYDLMETWFGYKIFSKNGKQIDGYPWKYPAVDIFMVNEQNGNIIYELQKTRNEFPNQYFKIDELLPLKKYRFGEIELYGANNPINYFDRTYGSDWNEIAYMQFDHQNEKELKKIKVNLTEEHRKPAQLTGPINK